MNIVIVGGGTAGWLAALMISKIQKDHKITVIESSKIDIIGAGEGSTGYLTDIIQNRSWDYGCNERDFFLETNATVKLGIKHKDWVKKGVSYYGPIDGTDSVGSVPDVMLLHALVNDKPAHTSSRNGFLISKGSSSIFKKGTPDISNYDISSHAYHFDAHKVGQYFKKVVLSDTVKCVDTEVIDIKLSDQGISELVLSNGQTMTADLYIDCTGFARKLISAVGVKWKSYKDNLPVNSAMPFLLPYKENEIIEPVTTAWAQSAGWMWQIPVQNRYGCGYVYDDRFITDDQAHAEIEQALGRSIDPLRIMKFDTGRSEKVWHKNCLALGLASAFAEPLEATSIHSTIVQLTTFIFEFLRETKEDTMNIGSQNLYNKRMTQMYDDFRDFLVLHYQTPRRDTKFWEWIGTGETRTDMVNNIIELTKTRFPQGADFNNYYGNAGAGLWNWILIGLGYLDKAKAEKDLKFWSDDAELTALRYSWFENGLEDQCKLMINNTQFVKNTGDVI